MASKFLIKWCLQITELNKGIFGYLTLNHQMANKESAKIPYLTPQWPVPYFKSRLCSQYTVLNLNLTYYLQYAHVQSLLSEDAG